MGFKFLSMECFTFAVFKAIELHHVVVFESCTAFTIDSFIYLPNSSFETSKKTKNKLFGIW